MPKKTNRNTQEKFPNFFEDLHNLEQTQRDIDLVEGYISSVLKRLQIPHMHKGKAVRESFFEHLCEVAKNYSQSENDAIEIDLYIGGGVVRTLLGNMYKFVYEQNIKNKPIEAIENSPVTTLKDSHEDLSEKDKKALEDQIRRKNEMIRKGARIPLSRTHDEPLYSPFVLGVGSDLDIYYEIKRKDGSTHLSEEHINAGRHFAHKLREYINELEVKSGLRSVNDSMKSSLLPVADVKEYHEQINRVLTQGGSMLDTLAFKLNAKSNERRLRHPETYTSSQEVIRDFLHGVYQYLPPALASEPSSQKQAIRGIRALLEIPFLSVKDPTQLMLELNKIVESLKKGAQLDADAIMQFEKMLRNANFQGAGNRAYSEVDSPLGIGVKISEEYKADQRAKKQVGAKIKVLLPPYLQKMPVECYEMKNQKFKDNPLYAKLSQEFISSKNFIEKYTIGGKIFHGTNTAAAMNILRGGFLLSKQDSGTAGFGPGTYAAAKLEDAESYSQMDGMVLPLTVEKERPLNIVKKETIDANWEKLVKRAKKFHFIKEKDNEDEIINGVYDMLRDREHFAIDIVLARSDAIWFTIQNQSAIVMDQDLNVIVDWFESCLRTNPSIEEKQKYDHFLDVLNLIGVKVAKEKTSEAILHDMFVKASQQTNLEALKLAILIRKDAAALEIIDQINFFDPKNSDHVNMLMLAAACGSIQILSKLIEKGLDIKVAKFTNEGNQTVLSQAALHDQIDTVAWLLERSVDPNAGAPRPLECAAYQGNSKMIELLCQFDADVDQGTQCSFNFYDSSPLRLAAKNGHIEAMETLIKKGASLSKILHTVAAWNQKEAVEYLIKWGADVNEKEYGYTPLMFAINLGHKDIALLLVENGARLDLKNDQGEDCFARASPDMKQAILDKVQEISSKDKKRKKPIKFGESSTMGEQMDLQPEKSNPSKKKNKPS